MRILGALSDGRAAPLVADVSAAGRVRRCALCPLDTEAAGSVIDLGPAGVFLAVPWRQGPDLASLLRAPVAAVVWAEAVARAQAVTSTQAPLAPDEVRFDRAGRALVLPAWEEGVERRPLDDWAQELATVPEPHRAPEAFERWCATAPSVEPELVSHPLAGQVLPLRGVSEDFGGNAPPKARVATVAALTLMLGLAAGWMMRPAGPPTLTVALDATGEVMVDCGSGELSWRGVGKTPMVPVRGRCRVEVRPESGGSLMTHLDVGSSGRYQCAPTGGDLTCSAL